MKPTLMIPALVALLSLGACSDTLGSKDAADIDASPGIDTSTLDAFGEADYLLAYQYVRAARETGTMPSGSATYVGGLGGDVTGDVEGFMTGAIDLTVLDLDNGTITGVIDNVAVHAPDGSEADAFTGGLVISGSVSGTDMAGSATGDLSLEGGGGTSDVTLNLDGTFRDLDGRASAMTGTASGAGTGGVAFNMADGTFYTVEEQ